MLIYLQIHIAVRYIFYGQYILSIKLLWEQVYKWWAKDGPNAVSIQEVIEEDESNNWNGVSKKLWQATKWSVVYLIWNNRNQIVLKNGNQKIEEMLFDIQLKCYGWSSRRLKKRKIDWRSWLSNPHVLFQMRSILIRFGSFVDGLCPFSCFQCQIYSWWRVVYICILQMLFVVPLL